ncbi:MAG: FIST C-terminal domain-containing protein [Gammaproteobacteria bacterium]|nr:FIST C-terminal domain-containing protein [Gammaproteobacteria bacterium]
MDKFLLGHSANKTHTELVEDCLQQLGDIPPETTLGFVYVSDYLNEQVRPIIQALQQRTGIQHWVGTVGMGIIATNQEYYDQPAMAIMLCDINEADFRILPSISNNKLSPDLNRWCNQHAFHVGLLHGGPENPHFKANIDDFTEQVTEAFLVGGISSSRGLHYHVADTIQHEGISGILFSDQVNIISNLSQGCRPIGPRHLITDAEENVALTLDHRPALDVLQEDTGDLIAQDWERASGFIFTGLMNQNSDSGDYTIRQLIGVDEHAKVFIITDTLEHHQELVFCRCDGISAQDDLQRMLMQMKSRLKKPPRGGIYISCLGRGRVQFGSNSEEIRLLHSILGDFPLVGFFANGEIHKNQLYGFTGVLTLFL